MTNFLTKCISDMKPHIPALMIGAIAGFALGLTFQSLAAFISVGPLLLALLCLAPCLAPILLFRQTNNKTKAPRESITAAITRPNDHTDTAR
ncbi:MAG: hypothetical protein ABIQ44_00170 [Chloroflexia bacterium]